MSDVWSGKQIIFFTAVVTNVLLMSLIWAKQEIKIPPAANPALTITNETPTIHYTDELTHVSVKDGWRIEHYEQYEITVDGTGDILSKKPTGQTHNMRYWVGK